MEPTLNFQTTHEENINQSSLKIKYFKKIVKPTDQELKNHKEYLKNNLKKNNFN